MIEVAALDPRRGAALGSKRTIDRHKIDQRGAGAKLIQPEIFLDLLDRTAKHIGVEVHHRPQIGHSKNQMIELLDGEHHGLPLPIQRVRRHYISMSRRSVEVTAELVLRAYRLGLFPMAEGRAGDKLFWLDPLKRGLLPLDRFHLPRRLLRTLLSDAFEVTADHNFSGTIAGCATPLPDRTDTWINPQIERLFIELFRMGYAHSVETWQNGTLVGGLYGVALGGVFFGESMFSFARDASKVALVHLVARLRLGGFRVLDTQFVTAHLSQFGAVEIPRDTYKALIAAAVDEPAVWLVDPGRDMLEAEFRSLVAGRQDVGLLARV
jgi:leucyl/phenylalanyl-tRNA--protein transferase